MANQPSKGTAALWAFFLGIFGADKFYVGATGLGILQLVLTLTLIGLIVSVPWYYLTLLVLVISILGGASPYLYPKVNWAPTTQNDKVIAYVIIGLLVVGSIGGAIRSLQKPVNEGYGGYGKSATKKCKDNYYN